MPSQWTNQPLVSSLFAGKARLQRPGTGYSLKERFAALEQLRQVIYGYGPATSRLQRLFEVAERKKVEHPRIGGYIRATSDKT